MSTRIDVPEEIIPNLFVMTSFHSFNLVVHLNITRYFFSISHLCCRLEKERDESVFWRLNFFTSTRTNTDKTNLDLPDLSNFTRIFLLLTIFDHIILAVKLAITCAKLIRRATLSTGGRFKGIKKMAIKTVYN
jgi:hypothetical protein